MLGFYRCSRFLKLRTGTDKPCYGRNNTGEYNDLLFTKEAIRLIEANDPAVPFFMFCSVQCDYLMTWPVEKQRCGTFMTTPVYHLGQVLCSPSKSFSTRSAIRIHGQISSRPVLEPANYERDVEFLGRKCGLDGYLLYSVLFCFEYMRLLQFLQPFG